MFVAIETKKWASFHNILGGRTRKGGTKEDLVRMVAGITRKSHSNHYYHVKKTLTKGPSKDAKLRPYGNDHFLPLQCLPERRYVLRPQWHTSDISLYSNEPEYQEPEPKLRGVDLILEGFSCLCFGGSQPETKLTRKPEKRRSIGSKPVINTRRVVYPIASYAGRLNSKRLIEQRRRSLPHNFFRPVPNSNI